MSLDRFITQGCPRCHGLLAVERAQDEEKQVYTDLVCCQCGFRVPGVTVREDTTDGTITKAALWFLQRQRGEV